MDCVSEASAVPVLEVFFAIISRGLCKHVCKYDLGFPTHGITDPVGKQLVSVTCDSHSHPRPTDEDWCVRVCVKEVHCYRSFLGRENPLRGDDAAP